MSRPVVDTTPLPTRTMSLDELSWRLDFLGGFLEGIEARAAADRRVPEWAWVMAKAWVEILGDMADLAFVPVGPSPWGSVVH
jgi:hypothetical protein